MPDHVRMLLDNNTIVLCNNSPTLEALETGITGEDLTKLSMHAIPNPSTSRIGRCQNHVISQHAAYCMPHLTLDLTYEPNGNESQPRPAHP